MDRGDFISILVLCLLFIIGIPLTVLLHELGHGLGLLLSTKDEVAMVYLGDLTESNKETFRIGRIHFHLSWGFAGYCFYSDKSGEFTKLQWVIFMLGGPLISLVLCLILISTLYLYQPDGSLKSIILWFVIANFTQFLFTIIPVKYPAWYGAYADRPSDGYTIWKVLRNK